MGGPLSMPINLPSGGSASMGPLSGLLSHSKPKEETFDFVLEAAAKLLGVQSVKLERDEDELPY